jgi:hypothetical protein
VLLDVREVSAQRERTLQTAEAILDAALANV